MQAPTRHVGRAFKRLRARCEPSQPTRYQSTSSLASSSTSPEAPPPSPSSNTTTTTTTQPPSTIKAAILLHRAPLLTPLPTPFEQSYYSYTSSLHLALSNPPATDFLFKKGSLTERRFLKAQWENEKKVFGEKLAGKEVDVGDIPAEEEASVISRDSVSENGKDGKEGDKNKKRIERNGEGNLYLLVKEKKSGKWVLPTGSLSTEIKGEALHEAAVRNLRESLGLNMDTWLVSRQPIGLLEGTGGSSEDKTFIFKSHILAGAPSPSAEGPYSDWVFVTKLEAEEMLKAEKGVWESVEVLLN